MTHANRRDVQPTELCIQSRFVGCIKRAGSIDILGDALIRLVDDLALAELVEGPFAKVAPHKLIGEPFSSTQGEGVLEKVVIAINRDGSHSSRLIAGG